MLEGDWVQVILKALVAVAALAGAIAAIFRWLGSRARTAIEERRLEAAEGPQTNVNVRAGRDANVNTNVNNRSFNTRNGNTNAWK